MVFCCTYLLQNKTNTLKDMTFSPNTYIGTFTSIYYRHDNILKIFCFYLTFHTFFKLFKLFSFYYNQMPTYSEIFLLVSKKP